MKINREQFEIKIIEEKIFRELKDSPMRNSMYIEKKYQGTGIDVHKVYRRIVNYQIKTYGEQLSGSDIVRRLDKTGMKRDRK